MNICINVYKHNINGWNMDNIIIGYGITTTMI